MRHARIGDNIIRIESVQHGRVSEGGPSFLFDYTPQQFAYRNGYPGLPYIAQLADARLHPLILDGVDRSCASAKRIARSESLFAANYYLSIGIFRFRLGTSVALSAQNSHDDRNEQRIPLPQ